MKQHHYHTAVVWTGNTGQGTASYRAYSRDHFVKAGDKDEIRCSSDPAFRGDAGRYNPEELFVSGIATCHMLWYLHLCADAGLVVTRYEDRAIGTMEEAGDGSGRFTEIVLRPNIGLQAGADMKLADELHHRANRMCFLANSCNFPIRHEPSYHVG